MNFINNDHISYNRCEQNMACYEAIKYYRYQRRSFNNNIILVPKFKYLVPPIEIQQHHHNCTKMFGTAIGIPLLDYHNNKPKFGWAYTYHGYHLRYWTQPQTILDDTTNDLGRYDTTTNKRGWTIRQRTIDNGCYQK